jgi:hypothetical protein
MTRRHLVSRCLLLLTVTTVVACRGSTTSVPLPAADSAAIMARSHADTASGTQLGKPAVYLGNTDVSPHPASAGPTIVQFVVDSTGAVRPSTFKVVRVDDMRIIDEAKRVLHRWHYIPAEVDGHKVSQLVQTAIVP